MAFLPLRAKPLDEPVRTGPAMRTGYGDMVVQMSDRSVLGPADVTDDELTKIVAEWLGADRRTR